MSAGQRWLAGSRIPAEQRVIRILLETVTLLVVCYAALLMFVRLHETFWYVGSTLIAFCTFIVALVRLPTGTGRLPRQIAIDAGYLGLLIVMQTSTVLIVHTLAGLPYPLLLTGEALPVIAGSLVITLLWQHVQMAVWIWLIVRGVAALWRQRQRHLRWSLTWSILVLLVSVLFLCMLAVIISALLNTNPSDFIPVDPTTVAALPTLLLLISVLFILASAGLLLIGFIPAALLAHFFSRQIVRRVERLARAADAVRAGTLNARVSIRGNDEIAQLEVAFNDMADALQRAVGQLEATNRSLQAERDQVAQLLLERRQMVATVSHELRTPVATMRGYIDSALAHWGDHDPETLHRDLQIMERECGRLQHLLDDLFTLARRDAGALTVRQEPTAVSPIIERRVQAVRTSAWERQRVDVIADVPIALPLALADEARLEQVLANLLANAIRHTPPGGVVLVRARSTPAALVLDVSDTGEGIPAEDLPRIFERFYRAKRTIAEDPNGAGLGLALVRSFTEAMSGTVTVDSQPGRGTTFTVTLPLASPL